MKALIKRGILQRFLKYFTYGFAGLRGELADRLLWPNCSENVYTIPILMETFRYLNYTNVFILGVYHVASSKISFQRKNA